MSIYDEMQNVARELLSDPEFRQGVISLIRLTPGNGPVDDPGNPTETAYALDGTARGVKFKYVSMGLAVASDLQITHSVIAVEPAMSDFVQVDGVRYKVVQVIRKPSAGTPVAFTLIIRR